MSVGRQNLCDWNGRGTAGVRSAQDNPPNSHFASRQHFEIMPLEGGGEMLKLVIHKGKTKEPLLTVWGLLGD